MNCCRFSLLHIWKTLDTSAAASKLVPMKSVNTAFFLAVEGLLFDSAPFLNRPPPRFLVDWVILHTHLHNLCDLNS